MPASAPPIERKLAAIFAADVAGYSRLMGQDEVGTLRTLAAHREIMDRLITEHRGRIANTAGDSVLAEFPSVVDAVQCAVEVQRSLAEANEGVSEDRRMSFRIGIHVGDVMVRGADLIGDAITSRRGFKPWRTLVGYAFPLDLTSMSGTFFLLTSMTRTSLNQFALTPSGPRARKPRRSFNPLYQAAFLHRRIGHHSPCCLLRPPTLTMSISSRNLR